jgi:hypothetical protein
MRLNRVEDFSIADIGLDVGLTRRILPIRDLGCGVFAKFFPRAADYMGVLLRCVSAD